MLVLLCGLAYIEHNPLVRLEAILGLSPSPIERFFGLKSVLSGMTEGVHQFVKFDIMASIKANVFAPLVMPIVTYYCLTWEVPKIDTKQKERLFFLGFIIFSVIVNILN
ncbi:MAG: hypothetical protein VSS75_023415 [Candidatus Parabeggiatoa sp.]|nr:hypothetical protein [Candidatus Parabeggiatoa sp.]